MGGRLRSCRRDTRVVDFPEESCPLRVALLAVTKRKLKQRSRSVGDNIDEMVRRIVERFDPERIILFGSHARGTAGPDSDVDLLVVMPVSGSKREKRIQIRVALHDIDVMEDIVVVTPDDVRRRRNIPGTIVKPALNEGRVLYARNG